MGMNKKFFGNGPVFFVFIFALTIFSACNTSGDKDADNEASEKSQKGDNPVVNISTNYGDIEVELYADKAPVTVNNFVSYVKEGFYDGTVFHRVIPGFMIQGGGFTSEMKQKETKAPITNEADNGLKNTRGSIAMARTSDINSATSQFFINLADNDFLNHGARDYGYAVFGEVTSGMDVVDKIASLETTSKGFMQNVPKEPVVIQSVKVVKGSE